MQRAIKVLAFVLMCFSAAASAKSGWRDIALEKDGRYGVDSFVMRGSDLVGYFEEIKESERVTDVVLVSKKPVTPEEENRFSGLAAAAGLKAHIKEGRKLRDAAPYVKPAAAGASDTSLVVPKE